MKYQSMLIVMLLLASQDSYSNVYMRSLSVVKNSKIFQAAQEKCALWQKKALDKDIQVVKNQISAAVDVVKGKIVPEVMNGSSNKVSANAIKYNIGGKPISVSVENIVVEAKKSFSEHFFNWLERGTQKKAVAVGIAIGSVGGYGCGKHSATTTSQKV